MQTVLKMRPSKQCNLSRPSTYYLPVETVNKQKEVTLLSPKKSEQGMAKRGRGSGLVLHHFCYVLIHSFKETNILGPRSLAI
jgi:hypothetical protein